LFLQIAENILQIGVSIQGGNDHRNQGIGLKQRKMSFFEGRTGHTLLVQIQSLYPQRLEHPKQLTDGISKGKELDEKNVPSKEGIEIFLNETVLVSQGNRPGNFQFVLGFIQHHTPIPCLESGIHVLPGLAFVIGIQIDEGLDFCWKFSVIEEINERFLWGKSMVPGGCNELVELKHRITLKPPI
jgi:hypothetical protein